MCFYIPNKPPCTCVFLQLVRPCNGARLFPSKNPTNPNPIIQVCGTKILARGAGQRYCHQCAAHLEALGATTAAPVDDTGTLISYRNGGSTVDHGAYVSAHPTAQTQQLPLRPRPLAADNNKMPVNRNLAELKGRGRTSPRHRRSLSGSKKQIPRSVPMSGSSVSSTSSRGSNDSSSSSGSDHSVAMIPSITITAAPTTIFSPHKYGDFGREIAIHGISGETIGYAHPEDINTTTVAHVVEPCIESDQTGEGTLMSYGDVRFLVELPDDERRDSNEDDGCA